MPQQQSYPPVSLGEWIVTLLIMAIPVVNVIMLFVWGFGNANPSKANWAKASLIFMVIAFLLYILIFVVIGVAFWGASSGFGY
jgi:uncharacterized membrane protein YdbT with pleckstrin-like domain